MDDLAVNNIGFLNLFTSISRYPIYKDYSILDLIFHFKEGKTFNIENFGNA